MAIVWRALGAIIIVLGLADVFLNVLAYDAAGLPVERSYRVIYGASYGLSRVMFPTTWRDSGVRLVLRSWWSGRLRAGLLFRYSDSH
jgi:hypothetical protein